MLPRRQRPDGPPASGDDAMAALSPEQLDVRVGLLPNLVRPTTSWSSPAPAPLSAAQPDVRVGFLPSYSYPRPQAAPAPATSAPATGNRPRRKKKAQPHVEPATTSLPLILPSIDIRAPSPGVADLSPSEQHRDRDRDRRSPVPSSSTGRSALTPPDNLKPHSRKAKKEARAKQARARAAAAAAANGETPPPSSSLHPPPQSAPGSSAMTPSQSMPSLLIQGAAGPLGPALEWGGGYTPVQGQNILHAVGSPLALAQGPSLHMRRSASNSLDGDLLSPPRAPSPTRGPNTPSSSHVTRRSPSPQPRRSNLAIPTQETRPASPARASPGPRNNNISLLGGGYTAAARRPALAQSSSASGGEFQLAHTPHQAHQPNAAYVAQPARTYGAGRTRKRRERPSERTEGPSQPQTAQPRTRRERTAANRPRAQTTSSLRPDGEVEAPRPTRRRVERRPGNQPSSQETAAPTAAPEEGNNQWARFEQQLQRMVQEEARVAQAAGGMDSSASPAAPAYSRDPPPPWTARSPPPPFVSDSEGHDSDTSAGSVGNESDVSLSLLPPERRGWEADRRLGLPLEVRIRNEIARHNFGQDVVIDIEQNVSLEESQPSPHPDVGDEGTVTATPQTEVESIQLPATALRLGGEPVLANSARPRFRLRNVQSIFAPGAEATGPSPTADGTSGPSAHAPPAPAATTSTHARPRPGSVQAPRSPRPRRSHQSYNPGDAASAAMRRAALWGTSRPTSSDGLPSLELARAPPPRTLEERMAVKDNCESRPHSAPVAGSDTDSSDSAELVSAAEEIAEEAASENERQSLENRDDSDSDAQWESEMAALEQMRARERELLQNAADRYLTRAEASSDESSDEDAAEQARITEARLRRLRMAAAAEARANRARGVAGAHPDWHVEVSRAPARLSGPAEQPSSSPSSSSSSATESESDSESESGSHDSPASPRRRTMGQALVAPPVQEAATRPRDDDHSLEPGSTRAPAVQMGTLPRPPPEPIKRGGRAVPLGPSQLALARASADARAGYFGMNDLGRRRTLGRQSMLGEHTQRYGSGAGPSRASTMVGRPASMMPRGNDFDAARQSLLDYMAQLRELGRPEGQDEGALDALERLVGHPSNEGGSPERPRPPSPSASPATTVNTFATAEEEEEAAFTSPVSLRRRRTLPPPPPPREGRLPPVTDQTRHFPPTPVPPPVVNLAEEPTSPVLPRHAPSMNVPSASRSERGEQGGLGLSLDPRRLSVLEEADGREQQAGPGQPPPRRPPPPPPPLARRGGNSAVSRLVHRFETAQPGPPPPPLPSRAHPAGFDGAASRPPLSSRANPAGPDRAGSRPPLPVPPEGHRWTQPPRLPQRTQFGSGGPNDSSSVSASPSTTNRPLSSELIEPERRNGVPTISVDSAAPSTTSGSRRSSPRDSWDSSRPSISSNRTQGPPSPTRRRPPLPNPPSPRTATLQQLTAAPPPVPPATQSLNAPAPVALPSSALSSRSENEGESGRLSGMSMASSTGYSDIVGIYDGYQETEPAPASSGRPALPIPAPSGPSAPSIPASSGRPAPPVPASSGPSAPPIPASSEPSAPPAPSVPSGPSARVTNSDSRPAPPPPSRRPPPPPPAPRTRPSSQAQPGALSPDSASTPTAPPPPPAVPRQGSAVPAQGTDEPAPSNESQGPLRIVVPAGAEVTELDILARQLEEPGDHYELLQLLGDILGPASTGTTRAGATEGLENQPNRPAESEGGTRTRPLVPTEEEIESLPVAPVELIYRRTTAEGRTKQKLEVAGVRVETCAICVAQFRPSQMACIFPCLHVFHADCARRLLLHTRICPLCRHDVADPAPEA